MMLARAKTVGDCLKRSADLLPASPSARLDIEVLLCYVFEKNKTWLYAYPEVALTEHQHDKFITCVEQRQQGKPIAYIVGQQEFWSLQLNVSPDTLIPRADTETLVEAVLSLAPQAAQTLLDLGTGTGAIALALASENPHWRITATDIKANAVALARENKKNLNLTNVDFLQSDWFEQIKGSFNFIVSNPPYISADDEHLLQGDVRFEPTSALVATQQGLADLQHIIMESKHYLAAQGWLLLEHGYQQGDRVKNMMSDNGYQFVQAFYDLQGHHRVTAGCYIAGDVHG